MVGNAPGTSSFLTIESWINDDMNDAAIKFLQGFDRDAGPALAAITSAKKQDGPAIALDLGGVVLSAQLSDPPGVDSKQAATLQKAGVVALKITARSQNDAGLVVRGSDMRLRLKDGRVIEPSSVSAVLDILEGSSQTGGVTAALTGAAIGTLVDYLEQRSSQSERELQFKAGGQSLFGDRILSAGKEETGIVLFRLPKDTRIADGTTLTAWVVDPLHARGEQRQVPFGPGSGAKGAARSPAVPFNAAFVATVAARTPCVDVTCRAFALSRDYRVSQAQR